MTAAKRRETHYPAAKRAVTFDPLGTGNGTLIGFRLDRQPSIQLEGEPFVFTFRGRYRALTGQEPAPHLMHQEANIARAPSRTVRSFASSLKSVRRGVGATKFGKTTMLHLLVPGIIHGPVLR